jgi:phage host-nuclease inhibitor protein Gam
VGRPKKAGKVLVSIEECVLTMADLLIAITDIEALIAERDQAVAASSARFEFSIDNAKARKLEAEMALQNYYYTHLAELERGGAKHYDLANGVMGRRVDPPALKPLNKAWTWEAIKVRVRELWPGKYFHEPKAPELDKELLKTLPAEDLKKAGMKTEAGETFYAEPARLPGAEAA